MIDMDKYEPHRCAFRRAVESGNARAKAAFDAEQEKLRKDVERSKAFLERKR